MRRWHRSYSNLHGLRRGIFGVDEAKICFFMGVAVVEGEDLTETAPLDPKVRREILRTSIFAVLLRVLAHSMYFDVLN